MPLWIALTLLSLCAAGFVVVPFLRPRAVGKPDDAEVGVLSAQIAEIDRDERNGEIDAAGAETQRTAIGRQLLEVTGRKMSGFAQAAAGVDRAAAIAVGAIVLLGSAVLYSATGSPGVPGAPAGRAVAAAAGPAQPALPDVDTMISRLAARLRQSPQDAEGWRMLGWSYFSTQRYGDAVDAYRRAVALQPDKAADQSALGEALVMAAGGRVSPESLGPLQRALALDAGDERAIFYVGLAKAQAGDARAALDLWIAALRRAAPDSLWADQLRAHALSLARKSGIDISARLPPAPTASQGGVGGGPAAVDAVGPAAAGATTAPAEQQKAMIDGMVAGLDARLAASPRDEDGWVRLMRSRMVLGQPDKAREALRRALGAFADDAPVQGRLREAAVGLGVPADGRP